MIFYDSALKKINFHKCENWGNIKYRKTSFMKSKDEKSEWQKPEVKDLGEAKDLIQNVFKVGTGDSESGMSGILASS